MSSSGRWSIALGCIAGVALLIQVLLPGSTWFTTPLAIATSIALLAVSVILAKSLQRDTTTRYTHEKDEARNTFEQDARLAAIIDSAMDAIITIDTAQKIVQFNDAAERIFGVPASDMLGKSLEALLPPRFREAHAGHVRSFAETGVTTRRMGSKQVLEGLRVGGPQSGQTFPIEASISQVDVAGEHYLTVVLRDVTERVQAEAEVERAHRELRILTKAASEALEQERRRVARELHDELGQQLTALKIDLGEARTLLTPTDGVLSKKLGHMEEILDQTVASTRRISSDLRPLMLDDLGLEAALEWLVQGFQQRSGVRTTLDIDPTLGPVEEPRASTIFRTVQESLTNVGRHSQANTARVTLRADTNNVAIVEITDNGHGFGPNDHKKPGSFGLLGIRERVRLAGGEARITNGAHGGAVVTARLPMAAASTVEGGVF